MCQSSCHLCSLFVRFFWFCFKQFPFFVRKVLEFFNQ